MVYLVGIIDIFYIFHNPSHIILRQKQSFLILNNTSTLISYSYFKMLILNTFARPIILISFKRVNVPSGHCTLHSSHRIDWFSDLTYISTIYIMCKLFQLIGSCLVCLILQSGSPTLQVSSVWFTHSRIFCSLVYPHYGIL